MFTIDELFDARKADALAGARSPAWRYQVQRQLAEAFGAIFGWRLSQTSFGPDVLARRGVHSGSVLARHATVTLDYWDHADYYRLNRRAAGVVAHLYAGPDIGRAPAWAAVNGLVAHVLPEIESWYSTYTTGVLYRPGGLYRPGLYLSRVVLFPGA